MTDIPIIFSGSMVLALLDGRKTMTRRLAMRPSYAKTEHPTEYRTEKVWLRRADKPSSWTKVKPGDRLWCRENWRVPGDGSELCSTSTCTGPEDLRFQASVTDEAEIAMSRWRPSIHMPRWASRITLVVTATKMERIQAISESDAKAEGASNEMSLAPGAVNYSFASDHFAVIWQSLHGQASWDANPEVVALTFTVHKENIDALRR